MTFQVSVDGEKFYNLYEHDGSEVEFTVDVDSALFASFPYIKIRSGTSSTPVVQAAERVITLISRAV